MNRPIFVLLMSLLWLMSGTEIMAQKVDSRQLSGQIYDAVTGKEVLASVALLDTDSTVVTYGTSWSTYSSDRGTTVSYYKIDVPREGRFILRCKAFDEYHVWYRPIDVKFEKRVYTLPPIDVPLRRRQFSTDVTLDSVYVTATKLKFYFDKDTLIYDASAFSLRQGAVLEDLIRQMPGAEIKDGVIMVGERPVGALLLNGKDFFNGDRKTILNNLPHYMINTVKVYEKQAGTGSAVARERDYEGYVMDVRLKRQYERTWMSSVSGGYGTEARYSAQAFLLLFSSIYRLSGTMLADNVNDVSTLGETSYKFTGSQLNANFSTQRAYIQYNYDQPRGLMALNGTLSLQQDRQTDKEWGRSVANYTDGDIFSLSDNTSRDTYKSVNANNNLDLFTNTAWRFNLQPSFVYTKTHYDINSAGMSFSTDMSDSLGNAWVDSLYADGLSARLLLDAINRRRSESLTDREEVRTALNISKAIKPFHTDDMLSFSGRIGYYKRTSRSFNHRMVEYIADVSNPDVWQNNYNKSLSSGRSADFRAGYKYHISRYSSLEPSYSIKYERQRFNDRLFLLGLLGEEWERGGAALGVLPSDTMLLHVLDGYNSYESATIDMVQNAGLTYKLSLYKLVEKRKRDMSWFDLEVRLPVERRYNELEYRNLQIDTLTHRTLTMFNPFVQVTFKPKPENNSSIGFSVQVGHTPVALSRLLNIRNTSNPLYISQGNPSLRQVSTSQNYRVVLKSGTLKYIKESQLTFSYARSLHTVATESRYDRLTGVTTTRPVNVEGNWNMMVELNKSYNLNVNNGNWNFGIWPSFTYRYNNMIDVHNSSAQTEPELSCVYTNTFSYTLRFTCNHNFKGGYFFNIFDFRCENRRATSGRADFSTVDVCDYTLRSRNTFELPHNWAAYMQTDFTWHSGNRYADLNRVKLGTLIEVQKTIHRSTVSLIVHDLLKSQRTSYVGVTNTGRSEVNNNFLGRYVMLRWLYRIAEREKK